MVNQRPEIFPKTLFHICKLHPNFRSTFIALATLVFSIKLRMLADIRRKIFPPILSNEIYRQLSERRQESNKSVANYSYSLHVQLEPSEVAQQQIQNSVTTLQNSVTAWLSSIIRQLNCMTEVEDRKLNRRNNGRMVATKQSSL